MLTLQSVPSLTSTSPLSSSPMPGLPPLHVVPSLTSTFMEVDIHRSPTQHFPSLQNTPLPASPSVGCTISPTLDLLTLPNALSLISIYRIALRSLTPALLFFAMYQMVRERAQIV